jgi:hypothetical protein
MTAPRKCGGDLHSVMSASFSVPRGAGVAIRPGSIVPCPYCDKPVRLRAPFNAAQSIYVQVPRHNRLIKPVALPA